MEIQAGKTHPMIIVAATAVTIASAAAIASFAGWLPGSKGSGASAPPTEAATGAPPPVCANCATVEGIREVKQEGDGTGLGAIGGGLLGNQIGNGRGRTLGAVVGADAGNEVEKNVRSSNHFEVTVRLDNGNTRVFKEAQRPSWQRGDRVRIENGQLVRM